MSAFPADPEYACIEATIREWHEQFGNSRGFSDLTEVQRASAESIIETFAEYAYMYLGCSPQRWDAGCIEECCAEILPRKITKGAWFFESLGPVLTAFFNFLGNHGLLPQGHSLAQTVEYVSLTTIINSENPVRWGPAKAFVMAARRAGFDLRNPDEMDLWCSLMNRRLLGSLSNLPDADEIAARQN